MSRWVEIYATTPSGKTLFICNMCGRTSVAPDKACPTPPATVGWKQTLPCIVLEELAEVVEEAAAHRDEGVLTGLSSPFSGVVRYREHGGMAGYERTVYIHIVDERIKQLVEQFAPVTEDKETDRGRLGH